MKLGLAISFSLLSHGIILIPWSGTTDFAVNSTPSSFQVALEQKKAMKTLTPDENINETKTEILALQKKMKSTKQELFKDAQIKQVTYSNSRLNTEDKAYIVKHITAEMENHFKYPLLARRNGWQGKVLLSLYLDAKGSIENVHIKAGSGYNILDQSALNALLKVRQIKKSEHEFNIHRQEIIIPVIYRLQEG